jgi:Gas vesicle synthesis protein GvpL/GvpF
MPKKKEMPAKPPARRAGKTPAAAPEPAPAAPPPRVRREEPDLPGEPRSLAGALSGIAVTPPPAESNGQSGKYVYCIIHTDEAHNFGPIGIGSEPADVHTVNYRDVAAVVSDTPLEVYDPTRDNVLAHERVNEAVMRRFTVIPMSFSTVFKTREDILELLRTAYDAFRDVLVKMQDKLEFGLKILWEPELVIQEIEKADESLRLLRHEISTQKGSTYFARMQYGRLVDSLLQERSEQLVSEIFSALGQVSVASRANKPIGDKMIMNAAFLVARDREADFDARVKEVGAKYEHLKFKYTGPWPPYNFVNIRLRLERATDTEPE